MSRLIVKNLPKSITAKKLEKIFSEKGVITDLQLKFSKDGVFRQFAFVGYKTDEEAQAAKEYFNNTFIFTSKISVDTCANLGDPNKPKSWKQKISDSKANEELRKEKKDRSSKKKRNTEIPEELLKDAQFKEFMEVNKDRKSKPVWAEDIDVQDEDVGSRVENDESSSDSDYDFNYKELEMQGETNDPPISQEEKSQLISDENENESSPKKELEKDKIIPLKKVKILDDSFTVKIRNLPFHCKKKQIKAFFHPLRIVSLRLPPKVRGFAYVKFETDKEMRQALIKNKGFLEGHRIDVVKYTKKIVEAPKFKNHEQGDDKEKNEELLAETGRIFIRNLCKTVKEGEIDQLFRKYGPLAEVHVPIDFLTKKGQGFAFVSFVFAEHAVKAFTELDGTIFQGRVMHLIPSKPKKEYEIDERETNYKKKKESKLKQQSGSSHNWNILFLGKNAVADIIAEKHNIDKSKLLDGSGKESLGVRMALAETEMVLDSREFLIESGVQLDAFSQPSAERSKTVIVVKHLPAKTDTNELKEVFSKFGTLSRIILPPSGLVALVEFENSTEAKQAFKKLAYSRFHNLPLYLEWAPVDAIKEPPVESITTTTIASPVKAVETEENTDKSKSLNNDGKADNNSNEPAPGTTIFVKNLNFETTQEKFRKHFEKWGPVQYATISTRTDVRTGKRSSMGFGFVQFKNRESAVKVVQNLQNSKLDGRALDLKFANREVKPLNFEQRKKYEVTKQLSSKIIVRNISFQATDKEVEELFSKFGTVKSVRLPKKLDGSGEHRGFGFVDYFTKDNAESAFNKLCHSTHFFGRRLVLEWAKVDEENVEELRKRTAKEFVSTEKRKKTKKRKLNEDVALASTRYGEENDEQ